MISQRRHRSQAAALRRRLSAEIGQGFEPWRPFRTWAGVLFRVAGDRDGLPWQ
jgi:hypothetical protein